MSFQPHSQNDRHRSESPAAEIVDAEVVELHPPLKHSADLTSQNMANGEPAPNGPSASLFERLLSPQSLSWMMLSGAGLLVVGLVVWLWSKGVFESPLTAALSLGTVNLGLVAGGLWMTLSTRFRLAGRGVTLLGCLLLPLNLWLYDAQGLISLDEGGQLWIPALVCSLIYAAVCRSTRDSVFVYALVGGVVLTGMLFLAGIALPLWSALPITTFLLVVAGLCIAADNFFAPGEGDFSRANFGLAFFRAGHMLLAGGLATLLVCVNLNWLSDVLSANGVIQSATWGTREMAWALILVLGSSALYLYSHVARPMKQTFFGLAIAMVIWGAMLGLQLLAIPLTFTLLMILAGLFAVAVNLRAGLNSGDKGTEECSSQPISPATLAGHVFLAASIGLLAMVPYFSQIAFHGAALFVSWMHVGQLLVAALACWTVPNTWKQTDFLNHFSLVFGATVATLAMVSATSAPVLAGVSGSVLVLSWLALPLIVTFAVPASLGTGSVQRTKIVATTMTSVFVATWMLLVGDGQIEFASWPSLTAMCLASLIFFDAGWTSKTKFAYCPGVLTLIAAVAQVFMLLNITSAISLIATLSTAGTIAVLSAMLGRSSNHSSESFISLASAKLANIGSSLIILGSVGSMFYVLSNFMAASVGVDSLALLAVQLIPIGVGYLATKETAWQRSFQAAAVFTVAVFGLTLCSLSTLSMLHRVEIVSLIVGAVLLGFGHHGWARETSGKDDSVGLTLTIGSLLVMVPLLVGLLDSRFFAEETASTWFRLLHEVGAIAGGVLLLGSGVLCRIRSTTLCGSGLLATYMLSLVFLVQLPAQLQNASVMMMVGGGVFFAVAVALSIYRDRILALPAKIKQGNGVFSVLKWR